MATGASAFVLVGFSAAFAVGACDPDLSVVKKPGEGGAPPVEAGTPGPTPEGGDTDPDATTDAGTDGPEPAGPHQVDGDNDFKPEETFETSSSTPNPYQAYFAWDATNVYFGMKGGDVGAGASGEKWVVVYFGGANGTTSGLTYGATQQPQLPFSATYHARVKTDLSYLNSQRWTGSAWESYAALLPDCAKKADFVECSVPRAGLGDPTKLKVHLNMLIETTNQEWTYAAVPKGSLKAPPPATEVGDGKDRDYAQYFEFDLAATTAPNTYTPLP